MSFLAYVIDPAASAAPTTSSVARRAVPKTHNRVGRAFMGGHTSKPFADQKCFGLDAAEGGGSGDAGDAEGKGGRAQVAAELLGGGLEVRVGRPHRGAKLGVHLRLVPIKLLYVLHPFEIADRDAS